MTAPAGDNGNNGGANVEVTNTPALRSYYENDKGAMTTLVESLQSLARDMEAHAAGQEYSIGWMTTDEFKDGSIENATGIQEDTVGIAGMIAAVAAKVQEKVGRLDAAIKHSLDKHTGIEDALSGGAAKSTASYGGN
jgi:hypothetical protein